MTDDDQLIELWIASDCKGGQQVADQCSDRPRVVTAYLHIFLEWGHDTLPEDGVEVGLPLPFSDSGIEL